MKDVCQSCGASSEQRLEELGRDGVLIARCRACGAIWPNGPKSQDADGPLDTVSRQPAFKVPVNTIDAPDPESVEDASNFGGAQATTPNELPFPTHRAKPLSRAVEAQMPGVRKPAEAASATATAPQEQQRAWCHRACTRDRRLVA